MEPRCRQLWLALIAIASLARPAHAQSDQRRVALVDPGPQLESAVRAALEPWNVAIVVVPGPSPGATAPDTNEAARALAEARGVSAVVWISEHDGRHALWVYDLETKHVIERELPSAPPYDDAAAAAAALSIKTLLRHSATAPPTERYGATDSNSGLSPELRAQVPSFSTWTSPTLARAPVIAGPAAPAPAEAAQPAPTAQAPKRSVLDLALGASLRVNFTRPHALEPRFGLAATFWPSGSGFGFGASVAAGPGVAIEDVRFDGRLVDATAALTLHARRDITHVMRMSVAFGGTAHLLIVDGSLPDESRSRSDVRLSPSLDLRQQTDWGLGDRLRLGLWAELSYLLRAERYLVVDQPVLQVSHIALSVGLVASLAVLE